MKPKGALSGLRQLLATENPSQNDEKCFLFYLKSLFHSEDILIFVLTFWSWLFDFFMTSQPGEKQLQYTLRNISRSKSNQTMKFSQLIEYNMRNIFLEKSCTKCGGEAISRPFPEKSKLRISLSQQSEFLFNLFYFISKSMNTEIYWN